MVHGGLGWIERSRTLLVALFPSASYTATHVSKKPLRVAVPTIRPVEELGSVGDSIRRPSGSVQGSVLFTGKKNHWYGAVPPVTVKSAS
jgi:hypothetical protein